MTTSAEERLRARLARYGGALEDAVEVPARKPRRHLVAIDGPVGASRAAGAGGSGGSSGSVGGGGRRRPSWRGPLARVAAVVVVLGALAGTTWAATRPDRTPPTTARAGAGWQDDDVVRPEDRSSAFAALDGTWPLPPGGSLRFVLDRPTDASTTFAAFRQALAYDASCLWFRHALELMPGLPAEVGETVAAMPSWPGQIDAPENESARAGFQEVVDATVAGGADRVREHLGLRCTGTAVGLGLPEIGGYWIVPRGSDRDGAVAPPVVAEGAATAVDPTALPGWEAISARLGPAVRVDGAVGLADGSYNVGLSTSRSLGVRPQTTEARGPGVVDMSLAIGRVRGPVELPVAAEAFGRGYQQHDEGVEVFVGSVADDATLALVVGPAGVAITLSVAADPGTAERLLGDLASLAVDLHAAAWPAR